MHAYKSALESKLAELDRSVRNRDDIAVEHGGDEVDRIHSMMNRELSLQNKDRESKLMREVQEALLRIEEDTFGTCLDCGAPIGEKRLQAVPWAALCVGCQELEGIDKQLRSGLVEDVA